MKYSDVIRPVDKEAISYPESSGSLVSGLVARRDSGEMEFFQFFLLVIRVTMRLVMRK